MPIERVVSFSLQIYKKKKNNFTNLTWYYFQRLIRQVLAIRLSALFYSRDHSIGLSNTSITILFFCVLTLRLQKFVGRMCCCRSFCSVTYCANSWLWYILHSNKTILVKYSLLFSKLKRKSKKKKRNENENAQRWLFSLFCHCFYQLSMLLAILHR